MTVFYLGIRPRVEADWPFKPIFERLQNISQKGCLLGVGTKLKSYGEYISIKEKQAMPYQHFLYKQHLRGMFSRDTELMHVTFHCVKKFSF